MDAWWQLAPSELAPALLVLAIAEQEAWAPFPGFPHPQTQVAVHAAAYAVTALALAWRRRAPLHVLTSIVVVSALEYLALGAPEGLGTFLPPLIALFAVGRHAPMRDVLVAAPLAVLATAVHELRDPAFVVDGPAVTFWAVLACAWPVGASLRHHEQRAHAAASGHVARTQEAVRAERARIARDLHDVVGHAVGVVVVQAVAATAQLEKGRNDQVGQRLAAIETAAREALGEMRRLVDVLDEGNATEAGSADAAMLVPSAPDALRVLVDRVRSSGVDVRLEVHGSALDLPAGHALAAYRLVQEALTNSLRHATGASVSVTVEYRGDAVEVTVADTGAEAMVAGGPPGRAGRGLIGMRERVALYGGHLQAGPEPGGGFTVRALLPLPPVSA